MAVPTAELERLSAGKPLGYNNDDYNVSTNPFGFGNGGHRVNLYPLTADMTVVADWLADEALPIAGMGDDIEALAAITAEITVAAANASATATVASLAAQITALGAISANITAVASNAANINTTAAGIANVNAVGGSIANVNAVAAALANITSVLAIAANIATVAGIAGNVVTVAGVASQINTLAAISPAVSVAASVSMQIGVVADIQAAITAVAGITGPIGTVAGAIVSVGTVAANMTAVTDAATNMSAIIAAPAQAAAAAASAATAANQASALRGTSASTLAIGTGSKAFTTQASKKWEGGDWVVAVSDANPTVDWMHGQVTAYSGSALTINVGAKGGTGTHSDWTIRISGPQGVPASGSGDFQGATSSTAGNIVVFDDTTGKVGRDSGVNVTAIATALQPGAGADNLVEGSTNKFLTSAERTKLSNIETAADVTDAANVGASIHGVTGKTTPADADTMGLIDSAASNVLKKVTWANVKATLKAYFDSIYAAVHANITALSGLTLAANKLPYATGAGALALTDLTSLARTLIGKSTAVEMVDTLGLIGANLAKSANYTVVAGDRGAIIKVDASGGARTMSLPAAATAGNGFTITLEASNAANFVTISANGAELIDGFGTYTLTLTGQSVVLRCNGTGWDVVAEAGTVVTGVGTGEQGTYKKFADGRLEIETQVAMSAVAIDQAAGTLFCSALQTWTLPHAFSSQPVLGASSQRNNSTVMSGISFRDRSQTAPTWVFWQTSSTASGVGGRTAYLSATGKWFE